MRSWVGLMGIWPILAGLVLWAAAAAGYTGQLNRPQPEAPALREVHTWTKADFFYQDESHRQRDIDSGQYVPENAVFIDVDAFVGKDGVRRLFVTTPSVMPGIPFTLSLVTNFRGEGGPRLKPFPNEHWHQRKDCTKIISAFRTKIDRLGRLWVLDTGKTEAFAPQPNRLCDPQILVFDLKKDGALIKQHHIPESQLARNALPVSLDVEIRDSAEDTFVYMTDPVTYSLIVYSMSKDISHVVKHPYFYPDPMYGFYNLNGISFTLMDGLFDVVVGEPRRKNGVREGSSQVYFHSLSAGREGSIKSDDLIDEAASQEPANFRMTKFQRRNHVSVMAMVGGNVMIFADLESNSLIAWNTSSAYSPENFKVIARDPDRLQFPSGLKVVGNEIFVLTSRIQNVMVGKIPKDEINYRILIGNVNKLLENGRFNYTDGYRT